MANCLPLVFSFSRYFPYLRCDSPGDRVLALPHIEEVRIVKPMSYHGLAFRVTRFSPVSGVIFDIIARTRKRDDGIR
jgi:hypothetical protein